MSSEWLAAVSEFQTKFGCYQEDRPTADIPEKFKHLRIKLLREEVDELEEALLDSNIVKAADACADILYVLLGTVESLGLRNHFEQVFQEVHRSNMEKTGGGKRFDGKILKPEGWQPPNIKAVLEL